MNSEQWLAQFKRVVAQPDEEINLAQAALLIATDEYPELDIGHYLELLDEMGEQVRERSELGRSPTEKIELLNQYFFEDLHFKGNEESFYDPHNSYLNDVLDRHTGIPITLSLVYIEIARRAGLPLYGVGLPGHFLVKWQEGDDEIFIDPFHSGEILDEYGILHLVQETYHARVQLRGEWVAAVGAQYVLTRILNNLRNIFVHKENHERALLVIEKLLVLQPYSEENLRDAGVLAYKLGHYRRAAGYLEEYLLRHPDTHDALHIQTYLRTVWVEITRMN